MIDTNRCQGCKRSRANGWILVQGYCQRCNPEAFRIRRRELLRQLDALRSGLDGLAMG